jgi:hypothetical protein
LKSRKNPPMAKFEQIRDHLPSLYRPEDTDTGVLTIFMQAVGALLDGLNLEMSEVMQSHWYDYADCALFNRYFVRDRQIQQLPQPDPLNTDDRRLLEEFPYIVDLARMGALLSLPPWREPVPLRERVEPYRTRLRRMVDLYRQGLGTIDALRAVVEAELPPNLEAPVVRRDRAFSVEEFAPLLSILRKFKTRGYPLDKVGPLMRWNFSNDGLDAVQPTIYIKSLNPEENDIDPAERPMVELYQVGAELPRIAIAYIGNLLPDQGLRLRPAYLSWMGMNDGLLQAQSMPGETAGADPTAAGPWAEVAGAPDSMVTDLYQSQDRILWVAFNSEGDGEIWRHNGQDWTRVLESTALSEIHCLAEEGQDLLIGTATGLLRMPLYPLESESFTATSIADLNGQAVYDILQTQDGKYWLATGNGVGWLNLEDDSLALSDLQGTEIYALTEDKSGVLYCGGALGLFQYQPAMDHWYWYHGKEESDQIPDWNRFTPGELPLETDMFLPAVTSIRAGPDTSLWIGTQQGICRYIARQEKALAYKTLLEAYPDLVDGEVYAIREDARGLIWFCTNRGLFRYDGRDLAQFESEAARWVPQGRANSLYEDDQPPKPRGPWRFNRELAAPQWQNYDYHISDWSLFEAELRSAEEDAVRTVLWTDSVAADLGTLTAEPFSFTFTEALDTGNFRMRVKPGEDRIVDGGLAAVPRMPVGESTWRYLSMETEAMSISAQRPWWSREGRLFPPEEQPAPYPARYSVRFPTLSEDWFSEVVFAYKPAVKVWFEWAEWQPFTALVRLHKRSPDESIHPAIIDRVWQGIQRVRPAGVRVMLAVESEIVRGG